MTIAAIALFATLSGSPALQAETPQSETRSEVRVITTGGPQGRGPGQLDADSDGVVTREEFSAPLTTAFDRLDADDDGRLTTEELAAGHGEGGLGGPGAQVMILRGSSGPGGAPMMFHGSREGGPGGPGANVMIFGGSGGPGGAPMMWHGGREGGPGGPGANVMIFGGPGGPDGPGGVPMIVHGSSEGGAQVFTFRHGGAEGGPPDGHGGPGESRVEVRRFGGPDGQGQMDSDNDGKVSEVEFLAPVREAFQSMDADHDGFLDQDEGPHGPPPPPPPAN